MQPFNRYLRSAIFQSSGQIASSVTPLWGRLWSCEEPRDKKHQCALGIAQFTRDLACLGFFWSLNSCTQSVAQCLSAHMLFLRFHMQTTTNCAVTRRYRLTTTTTTTGTSILLFPTHKWNVVTWTDAIPGSKFQIFKVNGTYQSKCELAVLMKDVSAAWLMCKCFKHSFLSTLDYLLRIVRVLTLSRSKVNLNWSQI